MLCWVRWFCQFGVCVLLASSVLLCFGALVVSALLRIDCGFGAFWFGFCLVLFDFWVWCFVI